MAGAVCRVVREGARFVVAIDAPLGCRALMDMLYALAPYKAHGPDRFSRVLDNWAIFDRAKTGGGASQNLFQQHVASLGDHWRIFGEHRDVFVSTFADATESYRVAPLLAWQKSREGKRSWCFDAEPPDGSARDVHFDTVVGLVTLVFLQPRLARNWPAWKPLVKGGKSNYIGPASVPMMALLHQRGILNSPFIRAIDALDLG